MARFVAGSFVWTLIEREVSENN